MQVWNVLHAARWKFRTQKWRKKSPSGYHRTTLSGYIFATKVCIDNRKKKFVKQQYLLHMSSQYGELSPTSGWDRFVSLGHPSKFQRLSRLDSVTARHSSSGRQPNFAALSRGCHLYSAGRPSRWALAHILVILLSQHFCEPCHFILKGCTDINVYCWKIAVLLAHSVGRFISAAGRTKVDSDAIRTSSSRYVRFQSPIVGMQYALFRINPSSLSYLTATKWVSQYLPVYSPIRPSIYGWILGHFNYSHPKF